MARAQTRGKRVAAKKAGPVSPDAKYELSNMERDSGGKAEQKEAKRLAKECGRRERFNTNLNFAACFQEWNTKLDEEDDGHIDPSDDRESHMKLPPHLHYLQEDREICEEKIERQKYRARLNLKVDNWEKSAEGKAEIKVVKGIMAEVPPMYTKFGLFNPYGMMKSTAHIAFHGIPDVEQIEKEVLARKAKESIKTVAPASSFGRVRKPSPKKAASEAPEEGKMDSIEHEAKFAIRGSYGEALPSLEEVLALEKARFARKSTSSQDDLFRLVRVDLFDPVLVPKAGDSFIRSTCESLEYHPQIA